MASIFFLSIPVDPIGDIIGTISWIFEWFNGILSIFFGALKYVLFALLLIMSIITLLRFKKNYTIFKANIANKNLPDGFVLMRSFLFPQLPILQLYYQYFQVIH